MTMPHSGEMHATADAAPQVVVSEPGAPRLSTRLRWKTGVVLLVLGAGLQAVAWFGLAPNRTWQAFSLWAITPLTLLVTTIWWLAFSRNTWKRRLIGLAIPGISLVAVAAVFRIDGYTGEMLPIFALRTHETAQQTAERYWRQAPPAPVPTPAAASAHVPLPGSITADDWPEFRGAHRDGVVRQTQIQDDWSAKPPRLLWRHPVGAAWSSFAVVGQFVYTQEQRADAEAVVCYDFDSGYEVWNHTDVARFSLDPSGEGPRATPTVADGCVYTLGATGILNCLRQSDGNRLWSHDILTENGAENIEWGLAASPLVFEELVIINPGGPGGRSVVAYDRTTGKKVWSAGNDKASYASPQLAELSGQTQILIYDSHGLAGHDPRAGTELWRFEWTNTPRINVAQPIVVGVSQVFISSGYGKGSTLLDIKEKEGTWSRTQVWASRDLKLKFNDAVARDGFVYGLDEGILTCLELATGKRRWKSGRFGFGQILLVDDVLLVQAESGEIVQVRASPDQFHELGRFPALDGRAWNCPVLCRGRLLVRNSSEAACYAIGPAPASGATATEAPPGKAGAPAP